MKFVATCQPNEPTAEFGVEIDVEGSPVLYVKYKEEITHLLYLKRANNCQVRRCGMLSRQASLVKEAGIKVVNDLLQPHFMFIR